MEFADAGGGAGYDVLLRETDRDNVAFEMDMYWITRAGLTIDSEEFVPEATSGHQLFWARRPQDLTFIPYPPRD